MAAACSLSNMPWLFASAAKGSGALKARAGFYQPGRPVTEHAALCFASACVKMSTSTWGEQGSSMQCIQKSAGNECYIHVKCRLDNDLTNKALEAQRKKFKMALTTAFAGIPEGRRMARASDILGRTTARSPPGQLVKRWVRRRCGGGMPGHSGREQWRALLAELQWRKMNAHKTLDWGRTYFAPFAAFADAYKPLQSADPFEFFEKELGSDCDELLKLKAAVQAKKEAQAAAAGAGAPQKAPLLEEEVRAKGVACRRALAWLETCSARVLEGQQWLADAQAAEGEAAASAHAAQQDWEAACAKQVKASAPPSAAPPSSSAINLSTLVDEGSLQIVDGPLFDLSGLELDEQARVGWERIKQELADSVQTKVQEVLGPSAQRILELREEARKLRAREEAKRRRVGGSDRDSYSTVGGEQFADCGSRLGGACTAVKTFIAFCVARSYAIPECEDFGHSYFFARIGSSLADGCAWRAGVGGVAAGAAAPPVRFPPIEAARASSPPAGDDRLGRYLLELWGKCRQSEDATVCRAELERTLVEVVGLQGQARVMAQLCPGSAGQSEPPGSLDFLSYWQGMDRFFATMQQRWPDEGDHSVSADTVRGLKRFRDGLLDHWRGQGATGLGGSIAPAQLLAMLGAIQAGARDQQYWRVNMAAIADLEGDARGVQPCDLADAIHCWLGEIVEGASCGQESTAVLRSTPRRRRRPRRWRRRWRRPRQRRRRAAPTRGASAPRRTAPRGWRRRIGLQRAYEVIESLRDLTDTRNSRAHRALEELARLQGSLGRQLHAQDLRPRSAGSGRAARPCGGSGRTSRPSCCGRWRSRRGTATRPRRRTRRGAAPACWRARARGAAGAPRGELPGGAAAAGPGGRVGAAARGRQAARVGVGPPVRAARAGEPRGPTATGSGCRRSSRGRGRSLPARRRWCASSAGSPRGSGRPSRRPCERRAAPAHTRPRRASPPRASVRCWRPPPP
ncbi:unnamed protein product, partial [Prorocentrum cordatum]